MVRVGEIAEFTFRDGMRSKFWILMRMKHITMDKPVPFTVHILRW